MLLGLFGRCPGAVAEARGEATQEAEEAEEAEEADEAEAAEATEEAEEGVSMSQDKPRGKQTWSRRR